MPTLNITLPQSDLAKAKEQARREGFHSPAAWVQFLVERRVRLEESPKLKPSIVISEMRKTRLYKDRFLKELEKSLDYADKTSQ